MRDPSELRAIGPWIRTLRERRSWSLQDLAEISGLSKPYLAQLERSEANPTETTLQKLAAAFGLRLIDLLNAALGDESAPPDSAAFREFVEQYKPDPDLIPALRELQLRGHAPKTAADWWRLYEVIRTLTAANE